MFILQINLKIYFLLIITENVLLKILLYILDLVFGNCFDGKLIVDDKDNSKTNIF